MGRKIFFQIFVVSLSMLSSIQFASAKVKPITLEKLQENKDYDPGCGCSVSNQRGDILMFSEPRKSAPAIVRIDGHKRQLAFVSSNEASGNPKLGDTFYKTYASGPTKMRINYKTTFVCGGPGSTEDCEVTRYKVDVMLKPGQRKNTLRSLDGDCGC
jgi:hypothetical protein